MSRIDQKVWQGKPFLLLAASPGSRAGANVMQSQEITAPFFGMNIVGKYGVGSWFETWDGAALTKPGDAKGIDAAVSGLPR